MEPGLSSLKKRVAVISKDENMLRILSYASIGLIAVGCATAGQTGSAARSKDPESVLSKTWQWEATVTPVEKITVSTPERYTITLMPDGKVQARLDCNRGGGSYEIAAGRLSFGPLLSTRMACPADSLDGPFMRDLQRVVLFFVQGGHLYLDLPYDSGTMRFRPAP